MMPTPRWWAAVRLRVDGFGEDLVAVLVEDTDCFRIRGERAGGDTEDETPLRQMIKHRRVDRNQYGVHLR
jgi:hypothetical protein